MGNNGTEINRSHINPFSFLSPLPLLQYLCSEYNKIHTFQIPGVCVGVANCPVEFPAGQHTHSDYEFIIPINNSVATKCDNKVVITNKQEMLPLNPGQYHGPGDRQSTFEGFICISCTDDFINKIAYSTFKKHEIMLKNESFSLTGDMRVLLSLFIEEGIGMQNGSTFIQENLANSLLTLILRDRAESAIRPVCEISHNAKKILRARDYLKEQFNSEFSLEEISEIAGLSPYYFIREFKKQTGKTPYEFILDVKIDKAKELLSGKDISITDICTSCGFNNSSHFSSIFKRKTGVSPSQYRKIIL